MKKILVLSGLLALISAPAHAITFTANGGMAFPGGTAFSNLDSGLNLGGEITLGLDMAQVGAFFDHTVMNVKASSNDGALNSYGVVARVSPPGTDLFGDLKLGLAKPTNPTGITAQYDNSFLWGVGVGYKLSLAPFVSLSPRVGYRMTNVNQTGSGISSSASGSFLDAGVLLSFGI
jgi:hypothetical protein